jgi:hypothetical protein
VSQNANFLHKKIPSTYNELMRIARAIPKILFIASLSLSVLSCKTESTDPTTCEANFIEGNFSAQVTYLADNYYEFKVCTNTDFIGQQVSVYGVLQQIDIPIAPGDLNTSVRLSHLADGLHAGDIFDVTFNNDDRWFVIYADDNGNLDDTTEILVGNFR